METAKLKNLMVLIKIDSSSNFAQYNFLQLDKIDFGYKSYLY